MSLVEKCWMITSNVSVIAVLIITGICFGIFVRPYLFMIVMFQNWKVAQEEQFEQELVLNQVSDMEKHIGEVEKLYQDIRSLRHDMGNISLEQVDKEVILSIMLQVE